MSNKTSLTLRNIYLYLVCFVTIIMIIFGLVTSINRIIDLFYNDYYHEISESQLLRDYKYLSENDIDTDMSFEEYKAIKDKENYIRRQNESKRKVINIVQSLSVFIVAVPFYLYHWRKIERERNIQN